jgi:hypothetical protein
MQALTELAKVGILLPDVSFAEQEEYDPAHLSLVRTTHEE